MVNVKLVSGLVPQMAILKYFPTEPAALLAITRLICEMSHNDAEAEWVIKRMVSGIYDEWPGPGELRACFCSRFKPKDGIDRCSEVYEIFPPDPTAQIAAQAPKQLEAGAPLSVDPLIEKATQIAIAAVSVRSAPMSGTATPEEIAAAPEWLRRLEGYE